GFTINLIPTASVDDAFAVEVHQLEFTAALDTSDLNASLQVGFLGAGIENGTAKLTAEINVDVTDPVPNEQLTLGRLKSLPVTQLSPLHAGGSLDADLPVFGGSLDSDCDRLNQPLLVIHAPDFFSGQAPDIELENFDDLLDFSQVSAGEVLAGLNQLDQ